MRESRCFGWKRGASDIPKDFSVTVISVAKSNMFFVYESTPHI
jgi:hypothetical protein